MKFNLILQALPFYVLWQQEFEVPVFGSLSICPISGNGILLHFPLEIRCFPISLYFVPNWAMLQWFAVWLMDLSLLLIQVDQSFGRYKTFFLVLFRKTFFIRTVLHVEFPSHIACYKRQNLCIWYSFFRQHKLAVMLVNDWRRITKLTWRFILENQNKFMLTEDWW